jgi:hypothetical protein
VVSYGKEIIARTEQYWCPIKHSTRVKDPHTRYYNFIEYGNAEVLAQSSNVPFNQS